MKNRIAFAAILILSLALAAYCGYVWVCACGLTWVTILIYICLLAASVVVADFMHEGAHWLVGNCLKMGVRIDNFSPIRSSSVTLSPIGDKHLKGRVIATTSAGLIVNLICIIIGIVSLCVPTKTVDGNVVYQPIIYLCVLLPYSFYLFALNAMPLTYSGGKTDGLVLLEILTNDSSAQVMLTVLKVQSVVNAGTPLEEIDEKLLLNIPQLPEDDYNFISLTQLRYEYYAAKGEYEQAEKYRKRFESLKEYM